MICVFNLFKETTLGGRQVNYEYHYKILYSLAPPTPPDPITVTLINPFKMLLSWNPTWPHPINSYTVSKTINATRVNYTTPNASMTFDKASQNDCYELMFAVSVNSDVGNSKLSNIAIKGFPTGDFIKINNVIELKHFMQKMFIDCNWSSIYCSATQLNSVHCTELCRSFNILH